MAHAAACATQGASRPPDDCMAVLAPLPVRTSPIASSSSGSRKTCGRNSAILWRSLHRLRSGSLQADKLRLRVRGGGGAEIG